LVLVGFNAQAGIIGVSIPVGSSDTNSHPLNEGVWSVSGAPPNTASGIGWLVAPYGIELFSMHDHYYVDPNVPDPARAVVTYLFDAPTVVGGVTIVEHSNGVNSIEGFYGNALGSMTSLGTVSPGTAGPGPYFDGLSNTFSFGNTALSGSYFQFVIRGTYNAGGYALFRAYPLDGQGSEIGLSNVPEPYPFVTMLAGLAGLAFSTRRRRARKPQ
jgi:hypothetical protein